MSDVKRGAVITIQLDIPDLASVRYERDVLDLIGSAIPWDKLPDGTRLIQARKSLYMIKGDVLVSGEPDVSETLAEIIPLNSKGLDHA